MMPYISVVCTVAALTFASSPTAAMGPPIVDAEERELELSGILANGKSNRALHALTAGDDEQMALRVMLSNSTEETVSVDFESFRVASEENLFKLSLGKLLGPEGWDALRTSNGQNFSTFDRDHDTWAGNCAVTYRGAWWYSSCHSSNLNGLNLNGPHDSYADGIEWSQRGKPGGYHYHSYPSVRMMIRPARSPLDRDNKLAPSSPPAS
ncbi:hypothetical protein HPB48_000666 [Haemaphysalis longicornis]|uniref:Fibrinogen C-terminal domain-containing protein n=1 Tax=Haemaphysalis longicornis TaxID=44386 RepID=A0A9J6G996_HAELO|nr:hypothetical protein HPB48_000666 [Haemaphysalis longicornis]